MEKNLQAPINSTSGEDYQFIEMCNVLISEIQRLEKITHEDKARPEAEEGGK